MKLTENLEKYWYLVIVVTVAVVYGITFFNQWTYDDVYVVVNNSDTISLSEFMNNRYPGRPLRELTHIIERSLFGVKPAGYHILQLILHASNGIFLYIFMLRAGIKRLPALVGALFLILHPFQSESVANIGHRKELLAFFFAILSLISFQKIFDNLDNKRHFYMLLTLLSFGVAMTGNETVITLPIVWLLYEYFFVPQNGRYLLRFPKIIVIASIASSLYLFKWMIPFCTNQRLYSLYLKNNFEPTEHILPHIMGVFTAFAGYWQKLLYPVHLAPEYVIPLADTFLQPLALCGIAAMILLLILVYCLRNSGRPAAFGISLFIVLYLPVSNILPVAYSMADRYMYIPLAGLAITIAYIADRFESRPLKSVFAIYLSMLATLAFIQNRYWKNEFTLWEHSVTVNPLSGPALESAAHAAMLNGQMPLAHRRAVEAARLYRSNIRSFFTLAMIEEIMGDTKSAAENYSLFISHGKEKYPDLVGFAREKLDAITAK